MSKFKQLASDILERPTQCFTGTGGDALFFCISSEKFKKYIF
ncbi:hypothetical protein [Paenibacillus arenosi]|nr:hypothetical protein [Paenibacillus arenosi]